VLFRSDQRFHGELMLAIWPPYQDSLRLNLFYERYPQSCEVHRVGTGTITTSSRTVTASTAVFKEDHVGSVLAICETNDTDIVSPLSDVSLVSAKRIITDYTSSTIVTIDQALIADLTDVSYYVSDPVDVQPGALTEALLRLCEYEMCRQGRSKHAKERFADFISQLQIAMADDSRYLDSLDDVDSLGGYGYVMGDVIGRPDLA
jgi:hypothetical protein